MSHSFIFIPFRDGELGSVQTQSVMRILETHQFFDCDISNGSNEFPTPLDNEGNTTIGDHVFVNCSDGAVTEIVIDRPLYDVNYRRLAFDLITDLKLAMMSSGGETLHAAPMMTSHIPDDVINQFGDVDTNVQSPDQLP